MWGEEDVAKASADHLEEQGIDVKNIFAITTDGWETDCVIKNPIWLKGQNSSLLPRCPLHIDPLVV